MRIYLDNCCYSRPYDGQRRLSVQLETEAKLFIQSLVKLGAVELVTSFVLLEEASADADAEKSQSITAVPDLDFDIYATCLKTRRYAINRRHTT